MLNATNPNVLVRLLKGNFGIEREGLRVTCDGHFSHVPHPIGPSPNIVRDFCENQTEINTDVHSSPLEAVAALREHTAFIQRQLASLPEPELYWPFSNPPFIVNEADIPIAQYYGDLAQKTEYRKHLATRYGRYKMTLSGIHVNFSFADDLLEASFSSAGGNPQDDPEGIRAYRDELYLDLAKRCVGYTWILTSITAASPLLDRSYLEKGVFGGESFIGMGSVRCGELGYWNVFCPTLDYSNGISGYADSIQRFVDEGLIAYPSELYYPVRLKPRGENSLDRLRENGVSHIELRMFDLNPFHAEAIDVRDVEFAQLLLVWLASTPTEPFSLVDQVQSVQNFKNAARYDLKTVNIVVPPGKKVYAVADAGLRVIKYIEDFYEGLDIDLDVPSMGGTFSVREVIAFEREKFENPDTRYAWRVRKEYAGEFVQKGLELAKKQQLELLSD